MKHPHFFKQDDSDAATFPLTNFGTKFCKQRFDIAPLDVSTRGAGEDQFESALVLPPHAKMVPRSGTDLAGRLGGRANLKNDCLHRSTSLLCTF